MKELKFRFIILFLVIMALFSGRTYANVYKPGWDYYRRGDIEKAVQYFQTGEGKCERCLCKIYSETGQYEKAVKSCEEALRIWTPVQRTGVVEIDERNKDGLYFEPKKLWVRLLCEASEHTGQYKRCIKVLKQWVTEDDPNDWEMFAWLANLYGINKQYDEGIAAAKRSIEIKPNSWAYRALAAIYADKKQYNDAIATYKKAIELDPKNISIYLKLSDCYYAKEDYASAIAIIQEVQEIAPNDPDILYMLGFLYTHMGKLDEAINSLSKAISLETITGVGVLIAIEGDYPVVKDLAEGPAKKVGVKVGDKIIKINGQTTKGKNIKEVAQAIRGAEGTQVVLTIERKDLKNPLEQTIIRETVVSKSAAKALGLRSLSHKIKGNTIEAAKDAEKAYSLDPDNDSAKEALAAIYIDKGKYDDAIKVLSNTSKDNYFARILEATAYAKTSDYKKAVEIYSSIPENYLTSNSVLRQSYKTSFFESMKPYVSIKKATAKSLEAKGQYREALNEYAEVLKFTDEKEAKEIRSQIAGLIKKNPYLSEIPEEARKYALGGEVLLKEGKLKEALQEYLRAVKVAPHIAIFYKTIALINGELKDYANAVRNMTIYLELMPDAPDARAAQDQIYKWEFMLRREKGVEK